MLNTVLLHRCPPCLDFAATAAADAAGAVVSLVSGFCLWLFHRCNATAAGMMGPSADGPTYYPFVALIQSDTDMTPVDLPAHTMNISSSAGGTAAPASSLQKFFTSASASNTSYSPPPACFKCSQRFAERIEDSVARPTVCGEKIVRQNCIS